MVLAKGALVDFPGDGCQLARDNLDIAQLVAYLRAESRERPVVIITVGLGQAKPYVNVPDVVDAAAGRADVVQIPTDDLTYAFAAAISKESAVYHGACRVYPPGLTWEDRPFTVPLRMARTGDEIASLQRLLLTDLKAAFRQPPPAATPERPAARPRVAVDAVPSPPPVQPAPEVVATAVEAQALAEHLLSGARRVPVVVVSRASGADQAFADVDGLRESLRNLADVVEIATLEATWRLSQLLPPRCEVYGGASRVYPVGRAWADDPYLSPLRFASGMRDRTKVTRQLTSDAMSLASKGSHSTTVAHTKQRTVTGTVMGVAGDRGLVRLVSGGTGTLWPELVEPGIAAEQLFCRRMPVVGGFDPDSGRIDVTAMRRASAEALSAYRPGETVLVRVASVDEDVCVVELFPGVTTSVTAQDVADMDDCDLRVLMSVGETLPALLVHFDVAQGEWLLSVREAGDLSEAVPAPSLLTGGPPWLVPARPVVPSEIEEAPVLAAADTGPLGVGNNAYIQGLRQENQQLADLLKQAESRVAALESGLEAAKTQARERIRRQSRKDKQSAAEERAEQDLALFLDERDQLDFEIRLAWARMTLPSEKTQYPLKKWQYSSQFFGTLRELHGISREKIVEVIVHVLTGRDSELTARDRHQLRTGRGGDDAPRTREGGEMCWRVALQHGTPSARRLHYWVCRDGSIELASVRVHDDFAT